MEVGSCNGKEEAMHISFFSLFCFLHLLDLRRIYFAEFVDCG